MLRSVGRAGGKQKDRAEGYRHGRDQTVRSRRGRRSRDDAVLAQRIWGTSIDDLERATRLRRGSLYNAFGDKQGLFVAALKRYETTVGQERIKQLSNPDPYRAIEGFLDTLVTQMSDPSRPRGCLHTNTSLEFPNAPDEVLRIIAERTAGIEGAFYLVLRRAQADGVLDPAADARALARFFLGVAKGIGVLHKVFGDASGLREIVNVAMSKWPYPQGKTTGARKRDARAQASPVDRSFQIARPDHGRVAQSRNREDSER